MVDNLVIHCRKAGCAVWHDTLALGCAHSRAKIRGRRLAEQAVPSSALGSIAWDNEISWLIVGNALADILDDSGGLVAED